MSAVGSVYLVGGGPGDPGLITVRGAECLRDAEVVIYDALASDDLLDLAPPDAERIGAASACSAWACWRSGRRPGYRGLHRS